MTVLGVTLDHRLTVDKHMNEVCQSAFEHCDITIPLSKTMDRALIQLRLDYTNSLLFDTSKHNIHRLQQLQNLLARVALGPSATNFGDMLVMLQHLHWHPVEFLHPVQTCYIFLQNFKWFINPMFVKRNHLLCIHSLTSIMQLASVNCAILSY